MLLDQARLEFAYEQIVQDAAKTRGACSVLLFVAPNCDAMCACRILSYMLRADAVSYKIKPVAGYGDIAAANEDLIKVRLEQKKTLVLTLDRNSCKLLQPYRISLHVHCMYVVHSLGPCYLMEQMTFQSRSEKTVNQIS